VFTTSRCNPESGKTVSSLEIDGENVPVNDGIMLMDDGREHNAKVTL
jgi:hypothetical protein